MLRKKNFIWHIIVLHSFDWQISSSEVGFRLISMDVYINACRIFSLLNSVRLGILFFSEFYGPQNPLFSEFSGLRNSLFSEFNGLQNYGFFDLLGSSNPSVSRILKSSEFSSFQNYSFLSILGSSNSSVSGIKIYWSSIFFLLCNNPQSCGLFKNPVKLPFGLGLLREIVDNLLVRAILKIPQIFIHAQNKSWGSGKFNPLYVLDNYHSMC